MRIHCATYDAASELHFHAGAPPNGRAGSVEATSAATKGEVAALDAKLDMVLKLVVDNQQAMMVSMREAMAAGGPHRAAGHQLASASAAFPPEGGEENA
jgi:hypothetical protein